MPDTSTPNYNLVKPEVTGSINTWGNKLNGDLDIIDTQLKTNSTLASNALARDAASTVAQRTAMQYLFLDSTLVDQNYNQASNALLSNGAARALMNILLPAGTIIMWAGTVATIPYGWALCNGQTVNGYATPNLIDRFVVQAGGTWAAGSYGGTTVLSYSGYSDYYALTANEMPVHTHAVYDPTHTHGISDPGHAHTYQAAAGGSVGFGGGGMTSAQPDTATSVSATGISIAGAATGISLYNAGASWSHRHPVAFALGWQAYWPQFYAVCYIMRVVSF